jgi:hypothetical protein
MIAITIFMRRISGSRRFYPAAAAVTVFAFQTRIETPRETRISLECAPDRVINF